MSLGEQWNYLRHITKLVRSSPEDWRFYMFCFVGALGVIVNLLVLTFMVHGFQLHPLLSSVIASVVAMGHNFLWNDKVTWKGHAHPVWWRRALQFPLFALVSGLGIAVTALFAQVAVWMHWDEIFGQLFGIIVATAWGFLANNQWTWKTQEVRKKTKVTHESELPIRGKLSRN